MFLSLFNTKDLVFDDLIGIEIYTFLRHAFNDIWSKAFVESNQSFLSPSFSGHI